MVVSKDSYTYNNKWYIIIIVQKKTKDINYNTGLYDQQSYAALVDGQYLDY